MVAWRPHQCKASRSTSWTLRSTLLLPAIAAGSAALTVQHPVHRVHSVCIQAHKCVHEVKDSAHSLQHKEAASSTTMLHGITKSSSFGMLQKSKACRHMLSALLQPWVACLPSVYSGHRFEHPHVSFQGICKGKLSGQAP